MFRYLGLVAVVSTLCTAPALAQEVCGNWEVVGVTAEPQGTTDTWLRAVKAFAEDDVWAVGHYRVEFPGTHEDYTLIQHWDGNEWRVVPSPSPGLDYDGGTRCEVGDRLHPTRSDRCDRCGELVATLVERAEARGCRPGRARVRRESA